MRLRGRFTWANGLRNETSKPCLQQIFPEFCAFPRLGPRNRGLSGQLPGLRPQTGTLAGAACRSKHLISGGFHHDAGRLHLYGHGSVARHDAVRRRNRDTPARRWARPISQPRCSQFLNRRGRSEMAGPRRFVLSAGHGSMLLWRRCTSPAMQEMTLDQVKNPASSAPRRRAIQRISKPGVETTTGPLEGIATAVGMAWRRRCWPPNFPRRW